MVRTRILYVVIKNTPGVFTYPINTADINGKEICDIEYLIKNQPNIDFSGINIAPAAAGEPRAIYLSFRKADTLDWLHYDLPLLALIRNFSGALGVGIPANNKQWSRLTGRIDWTTSYVTTNYSIGADDYYYIALKISYIDGSPN
jgi:hypothetical protein